MGYRNLEGYADPTAGEAIARVYRETRECGQRRPLVYICSPFSGDPEGNTERARAYCRFALDRGVIPLAPHLFLPSFMEEKKERNLAMQMDIELLRRCEELWVFGKKVTDGMGVEIREAKDRDMPIRFFTEEDLE